MRSARPTAEASQGEELVRPAMEPRMAVGDGSPTLTEEIA